MREYRDLRGNAARGLELIISAGKAQSLPKETLTYNKHPFGLKTPDDCTVYVVTEGSGCDINVKATTSLISRTLGSTGRPPQLRMITIREVEDYAERRYFFEVGFGLMSIIGGTGTHYSGHGGDTTRQMRSVLLAIGMIHGQAIEEEVIFADDVAKFDADVLGDMRHQLRDFLEPHRAQCRAYYEQYRR